MSVFNYKGHPVKQTHHFDLTSGNITKHMMHIATPAMWGLFFGSLYNWTDTFWGGKISTDALAAFSLSFPIFLASMGIVQCIFSGTMVLISNSLGAGEKEKAQYYLEKAVVLSFTVGVGAMISIWIIARPILRLLGGQGEVLEMACAYLQVLATGIPFMVSSQTLNAGFISRGNTRFQRNLYIMNALINLGLDPLLLYGLSFSGITIIPPMGIRGVALATTFVFALGASLSLRKALRERSIRTDSLRRYSLHVQDSARILYYGLPALLQLALVSFGLAIVNFFLYRLGGSPVVAGYGIGLRIEQLALIPSIGIGTALSAIVGQNNGAKHFERIRKAYKVALTMALLVLVLGMLPLSLFGRHIAHIFSGDTSVITVVQHYLWFALSVFFAYQLIGLSSSTLQGMKHPLIPIVFVVLRQLVLPWAFIPLFAYAFAWGIHGVFSSVVVCAWINALSLLICLRAILRKKLSTSSPVREDASHNP